MYNNVASTHTQACTHARTHAHTHARRHAHTHTHTYTHTHTQTHACAHTAVNTQIPQLLQSLHKSVHLRLKIFTATYFESVRLTQCASFCIIPLYTSPNCPSPSIQSMMMMSGEISQLSTGTGWNSSPSSPSSSVTS